MRPVNRTAWFAVLALCGLAWLAAAGCASRPAGALDPAGQRPVVGSPGVDEGTPDRGEHEAFLDTLSEKTFRYFWELSDPQTGLTPDRAPSPSFCSVAAVGFALTAYGIGAERGYVERREAATRVVHTLRYFRQARQDTTDSATGWQGFFYHFLDQRTGARFGKVELSTVDTALFLAGALFCQSYFDREDPLEGEIRALAESLYVAADWTWASPRAPLIGHGWTPEEGFLPYDWGGYSEAMILYLLALASPTHPVAPAAWDAWVSGYRWGSFYGQEHIGFAALFGHQFTHCWIDLRGVRDAYTRKRGLDYFENSRRAVLAQRAYALENPMRWSGYGPNLWGLTACDGPVDGEFPTPAERRAAGADSVSRFHTYWARGASFSEISDDGTICPSAAGGSIAFAPDLVVPTLLSIRRTYGERIFGRYGFYDALNPSFRYPVEVQHGWVDPQMGWFDDDYLGIDQGPILLMLENHRSGLVWKVMRRNHYIREGLRRAGFTGGWLDREPEQP